MSFRIQGRSVPFRFLKPLMVGATRGMCGFVLGQAVIDVVMDVWEHVQIESDDMAQAIRRSYEQSIDIVEQALDDPSANAGWIDRLTDFFQGADPNAWREEVRAVAKRLTGGDPAKWAQLQVAPDRLGPRPKSLAYA